MAHNYFGKFSILYRLKLFNHLWPDEKPNGERDTLLLLCLPTNELFTRRTQLVLVGYYPGEKSGETKPNNEQRSNNVCALANSHQPSSVRCSVNRPRRVISVKERAAAAAFQLHPHLQKDLLHLHEVRALVAALFPAAAAARRRGQGGGGRWAVVVGVERSCCWQRP